MKTFTPKEKIRAAVKIWYNTPRLPFSVHSYSFRAYSLNLTRPMTDIPLVAYIERSLEPPLTRNRLFENIRKEQCKSPEGASLGHTSNVRSLMELYNLLSRYSYDMGHSQPMINLVSVFLRSDPPVQDTFFVSVPGRHARTRTSCEIVECGFSDGLYSIVSALDPSNWWSLTYSEFRDIHVPISSQSPDTLLDGFQHLETRFASPEMGMNGVFRMAVPLKDIGSLYKRSTKSLAPDDKAPWRTNLIRQVHIESSDVGFSNDDLEPVEKHLDALTDFSKTLLEFLNYCNNAFRELKRTDIVSMILLQHLKSKVFLILMTNEKRALVAYCNTEDVFDIIAFLVNLFKLKPGIIHHTPQSSGPSEAPSSKSTVRDVKAASKSDQQYLGQLFESQADFLMDLLNKKIDDAVRASIEDLDRELKAITKDTDITIATADAAIPSLQELEQKIDQIEKYVEGLDRVSKAIDQINKKLGQLKDSSTIKELSKMIARSKKHG